MSFRITPSRLALSVVLCYMAFCARSGKAEEILRNSDVEKMVSARLGDDIIVSKVREAPRVEFQLAVDDLVALRTAGVSDRVVQAMLERSKAAQQASAQPHGPRPQLGSAAVGVSLKTAEGMSALRLAHGTVGTGGVEGYFSTGVFINFPGLRSPVRTHDKRPVLLITCPTAPEVGHYFLAKVDPDKVHEVRSLKIGQTWRKRGNPGGRLAPDSNWVLPFDLKEENPGTWRVTVKDDLEPGEYGWYVNLPETDANSAYSKTAAELAAICFEGGGLFDFGID